MTARRRLAVLSLALSALLAVGAPRPARAGDVEEARRAARAAVVDRLADLAEWAASGQLWLQRTRVARAILRFDPSHPKALAWLKYEKAPNGTWRPPAAFAEPKDAANAGALPEFMKRRADVAAEFRNRLFEALDREGPSLAPAVRERAIEDVLAVGPDDPVAREANGELERASAWILKETSVAPGRRAALVAAAKAALAAVPEPASVPLLAEETALEGGWDTAFATAHFRAVGMKPGKELSRAARTAQAAISFFATAFGVEADELHGFTLLHFPSLAAGTAFISRSKAFPDGPRALALHCNSYWVPGARQVLIYSDDPRVREEWPARHPIGEFLYAQFGVTLKTGWAQEGFGVYLSYLLTGQHRTFLVRISDYATQPDPLATALWKRLMAPETDWMAEAKAQLARMPRGDLRLLLGKDVNLMRGPDLVISYALAAFFLEGRPSDTPGLLTDVGSAIPIDDAVSRRLHRSVDGLEARFRRFLDERKSP